jgi:DNA repair exonuclease SbcCD nuclease subunit
MIVVVGDPHVRKHNLQECAALFSKIWATADQNQAEAVVLLGDLFHTHALLDLEVIAFWRQTLRAALQSSHPYQIVAIAGNHDQSGDIGHERAEDMTALSVLPSHPRIKVVESSLLWKNLGFVAHTTDEDRFLSEARGLHDAGAKTLFCHQTFAGAQYDNGFYAPDGFDEQKLPEFQSVISGHIHTQQSVGRVFYPGTPKWDTKSDANENKGFWLLDNHKMTMVATEDVCTPVVWLEIREGENENDLKSLFSLQKTRIFVDLRGSSRWITSVASRLKGIASVSARPTDVRPEIRPESGLDFTGFLLGKKDLDADIRERVLNYVKEL